MMTPFDSTSDFVIGFTNTLIHSLWIGALLWLIMKALLMLVRDSRAGIRYWISTSGILLFVSATVVLFTQLYTTTSPTELMSGEGSLRSLFLLAISDTATLGEISSVEVYYHILLKIYLLGLTLFTLRWIVSAFQIRIIINKAKNVESSALVLFENLKQRLGIRKNISLLISGKLKAPVLYGFFKPVIIVPLGMFFNLPREQVESILIHELIHVKRMDFFINILQSIVEMLFFFNPFVWMISRQIRVEREKYCDDLVVDSGSSPSVYAKALLNLSLLQTGKYNLAISATGNNRNVLLKRIQRLLNINTMKTRNNRKAFFTYLVVVSFFVVFITSAFSYSFFTIDKGGNDTMKQTESTLNPVLPEADVISDLKLTGTADPHIAYDTIIRQDLDSLSEEEWEEYKLSLEEELEKLKELDWDEVKEEFELNMQEMHAEMEINKEKLMLELELAREEMKNLNKDEIKLQLKEAKLHMDSIRENVDWEKIEQELELTMQDIEIDIQEIMLDIEEAMQDIDFDIDYDFDFEKEININFDSIMKNAQIAIEEIDFEEIKQNIEEAMQKMEKELQEMDERTIEKNEEK